LSVRPKRGGKSAAFSTGACSDLVTVSVDADVEPMEFATKVVAAITSGQYGEYRALIRAIASAQPWAPAYVSDLEGLAPSIAGGAARSE
jgi:hypothetical protein